MKKFLVSLIALTMITQSNTNQDMNTHILQQIKVVRVKRANNKINEYPIVFSLDRKQYAIAYDKTENRRYWGEVLFSNLNAIKDTTIFSFKKPEENVYQIGGLAYSPDGKMIAIGRRYDITLIDAFSGKVLQTLPTKPTISIEEEQVETDPFADGEMGAAGSLNFSPDGKKLLGYAGGTVNIWSIEDGKFLKIFQDKECYYSDSFTPIFAPNGKTFALQCHHNYGFSIKIIDTQNYHTVKILKEHDNSIISLVFSPSGNLLASSSAKKGVIKVWNVDSGNMIKEFEGNRDEIVVYIDKNTMVTLDDDSEYMYILKTWSLKDGKVVRVQKLSEYLKELVPSIGDALKQLPVKPR